MAEGTGIDMVSRSRDAHGHPSLCRARRQPPALLARPAPIGQIVIEPVPWNGVSGNRISKAMPDLAKDLQIRARKLVCRSPCLEVPAGTHLPGSASLEASRGSWLCHMPSLAPSLAMPGPCTGRVRARTRLWLWCTVSREDMQWAPLFVTRARPRAKPTPQERRRPETGWHP